MKQELSRYGKKIYSLDQVFKEMILSRKTEQNVGMARYRTEVFSPNGEFEELFDKLWNGIKFTELKFRVNAGLKLTQEAIHWGAFHNYLDKEITFSSATEQRFTDVLDVYHLTNNPTSTSAMIEVDLSFYDLEGKKPPSEVVLTGKKYGADRNGAGIQGDITLSSLDVRDAIEVSWICLNQNLGEVFIEQTIGSGEDATTILKTFTTEQVFRDDMSTEQRKCKVVIPPNTFQEGNIEIYVRSVFYKNIINPSRRTELWDERINLGEFATKQGFFSLTESPPQIFSVTPNQDSGEIDVDSDITVEWDSELQESYSLELKQSGNIIKRYTGGVEKSVTVPARTLSNTTTEILLTVKNAKNGFERIVNKAVYFNTKDKKPVIIGLEPDGVNQDVEKTIIVSWESRHQDTYSLKIFQEGQQTKELSGETEKSVTLPPNTLKNAVTKLNLTVKNVINGKEKTTSKEVLFVAYGRPEQPVLEDVSHLHTSQPEFHWASKGQIGYEFKIVDENKVEVDSSGIVISPETKYMTQAILENGKSYEIKLRIKNKYELFCDWVSKTIQITYDSLPKAVLTLIKDGDNVLINGTSEENEKFHHCTLLRKAEFERKWTVIADGLQRNFAFTDTALASGMKYYYKVYSLDKTGGVTESDIKSISVMFGGCRFQNVETSEELRFDFITSLEFEKIQNIAVENYLGNVKPTTEKDKMIYMNASIVLQVTKKELYKLQDILINSNVILYTGGEGNRFFFTLKSNISWKRISQLYYEISFSVVEVEYNEHRVKSPCRLVYVDGVYEWEELQ